jgi:hypothetical protein
MASKLVAMNRRDDGPRKARRLAAPPGCPRPTLKHLPDDAAGHKALAMEATPPTPPNVTWLRDHFQKARLRREREVARTDTNLSTAPRGPQHSDVVFAKVPIAPIVPRAPSPDLGYIGQLERTRSLHFLLCPSSGLDLRSAQQNLALCTVLLDENGHCLTDNTRHVAKAQLRECLQLVVESVRRRVAQ